MAVLTWTVTPERAFGDLAADYVRRIEAGVVAIAEYYAPQIMDYMKAEHVWQNRTTAAEHGLHTEVNHMVGAMVEIVLAHGADVEYGIWLEVANQGRFQIIAPSIDVWAPHVWGAVVHMLR